MCIPLRHGFALGDEQPITSENSEPQKLEIDPDGVIDLSRLAVASRFDKFPTCEISQPSYIVENRTREACLEVPGANGQGETEEECLRDLSAPVKLILEVNEEEVLRDHPNAVKTSLAVG